MSAARFADPVELYDLCHQWLDHAAVGQRLSAALREHGLQGGATVLEAACGSGLWLSALGDSYRRSGFDLDPRALARAQGRVPDGSFFVADLGAWTAPAPVDAVLALFGALAYLSDQALPGGVRCMVEALKPGGLALVEPWVRPGDFEANRPQLLVLDSPHLKLCRQVLPRREGDQAVLDFHHLVSGPGLPPRLVRCTERLNLREDEALDLVLHDAGLRLEGRIQGTMPDRQIGIWRRPA